jgi:DNA-binding NtrC family response regulator
MFKVVEQVTDIAVARDEPIVADAAMVALYRIVDRLAQSDLPVLLLGETGVGKEVIAEQLHERSSRCDRPLIRINCAALSEPLLESELFGHLRGAFTGANHDKPGLLVAADGGTVLLDEVADLPLAIQAKLLRVLENGEVLPVGAVKSVRVDVRFVAATNGDLEAAIARRAFRADLFHRLDGATLTIPPLRERRDEIRLLAHRFLQRAARHQAIAVPTLSPDADAWITSHSWPGNVRELRHVIERAVLFADGDAITCAHLPRSGACSIRPFDVEADAGDPDRARTLDAIARCHGNQTRAARMLGIARSTLVKRLDAYKAPRPRKA